MPDSNMSIYDDSPGNSAEKGGFGDPDMTPKPLRIVKNGGLPKSDPVANKSFPCISKSESQRSLVPVRRSSVWVELSPLDLSQQDLTSPTPHSSEGSNSLYVRKHRLSDSGYSSVTSSAPSHSDGSPLVPAHAGSRNQRASMMLGGQLGVTLAEFKTSIRTRPAPTRAFTTGVSDKATFLGPINDEPLTSPTPLAALTDCQRAVTSDVESHNPTEATKINQDHAPRRQASFRNRFMTRVMSGFTDRAHNGRATSNERPRTPQMPPQRTQAPVHRPRHQHLGHANRDISSRTEICFGNDLDGALSAFPTPPTSNDTSPTTTSSRQNSVATPPPFRIHSEPETSAIMGPQVEVTPEYEEMNAKNGETMLVAIDVQGALNATTSGQNLWNTEVGLDVVVIIDNSFYASTSTLMASCETARSLAWMLNVVLDRMAILCTSAPHNAGSDTTIIRPLSQPSTMEITRALDKISATTSIESYMASVWDRAIKQAKSILIQSKVPNAKTEALHDVFGHIFILTANAEGLSSTMLCDDRLRFHVICAGTLARENYGSIDCNGWKLRSMSGTELRSVSAKKDTDPTSLLNRLRGLIMHARGGKVEGQVSDLVLDIVPGQGYEIAGEMGSRKYSTLNLGHLSTILVNLKLKTANAQGNTVSYSLSQPANPINATNIWTQLDQMLGLSEVKLVTAKLRYRHSLLPEGTTCSITNDCYIRLKPPDPSSYKMGSRKPLLVPTECTALVHKRWAYQIATHHPPKAALSSLRTVFGESGSRSSSPGYLKLISDELKHQVRIIERLEIDTPRKRARSVDEQLHDEILAEQLGQLHTGGKTPRVGMLAENQRPEEWITVVDDEGVPAAEAVHSGSGTDSSGDPGTRRRQLAQGDKARRVLGRVGDASGSPKHAHIVGHSLRTASFGREQERKKTVRDVVGGGTRNLASGTFRTLVAAGESMGKGMGAQ